MAAFNEKRDVKPVVEWKVGKVIQEGRKEAKKDEIYIVREENDVPENKGETGRNLYKSRMLNKT